MNITLNKEKQPDVTILPNDFIEHYMAQADGEFVKIYLLLLHLIQSNNFQGMDQIADLLELTQKDVIRAFYYWEGQGLIHLEKDETELSYVYSGQSEKPKVSVKPQRTIQPQIQPRTVAETPSIVSQTPSVSRVQTVVPAQQPQEVLQNTTPELSSDVLPVPNKETFTPKAFQSKSERTKLRHSIYMMEMYLGRPLSQTELNSLCYIDTALAFSPDLLEYLIEYCVSREKKSMRYMESVAINWYQHGIDTVEKAKNESTNYTQNVFGIMRALGIANRNPGKSELDYIKSWNQMGFSTEIIEEACSRTLLSTHQASFPYANRILESWKSEGVHTLEDIQSLDNKRRSSYTNGNAASVMNSSVSTNAFHNFEQRTYDYDDLESKLLHS